MKKILLILVAVIGIFVLLIGCKKDKDDPKPNATLTEQEKQEIISSYEDIRKIAVPILLEDGIAEDFEKLIPDIKDLPMVEKAWVEGNSLWVKFKKGGVVSWSIKPKEIVPPYIEFTMPINRSLNGRMSENMPGNKKACLINQQSNDEERPYCKEIISTLDKELSKNGYEVTIVNAPEADVKFFEKELSKYGVIFFITHGVYSKSDDITWYLTGEEPSPSGVDLDKSIIEFLINKFYSQWLESKITVMEAPEHRNLICVSVPYYAFSDRFIDNRYSNNSFPNSLTYWVACQGMKSDNLGKVLSKKGAGVTIGWDETNCLGQFTGMLLFQGLLGGYSVQDVFEALPTDAKVDYCGVSQGANLVYYPDSGGTMCLVGGDNNTSISVFNPIPGLIYDNRVVKLNGTVNGFSKINSGTVEVNGVTTILTKISNTNFEQPLVINQGENKIKLTCYGELKDKPASAFASTELTIYGDFPPLALFSQLTWNTNYSDVDFHLLPPNSTISDLWTNKDCYYANKSTSWGAYLDVDNTNGYGPEHITIPNTPAPGIYTLYVHYYGAYGAGTTNAFVAVSANNGDIAKFGPYKLEKDGGIRAGDVWAVCTIEYPSGIITPLNQYHYLGKSKSSEIKKK